MDWERLESARMWARFMLAIPIFLIAYVLIDWAVPVSWTSNPSEPRLAGLPISDVPSVVGVVGFVIGLAWMWRIYRAPTKVGQADWRYRDR
jgi:hypothetical protein